VKEQTKQVTLDRDDDLERELEAQFAASAPKQARDQVQFKTRAEEEAEAKEKEAEDAANMARLKEMREKRDQAKKEREAAAEKAKEEETKKVVEEEEQSQEMLALCEGLEKLLSKASEGKMTVNQLNQDASAKKLLKPLMKKANVKALNKDSLTKLAELKGKKALFKCKEEKNLVFVQTTSK